MQHDVKTQHYYKTN